jgi:hypothetical protein
MTEREALLEKVAECARKYRHTPGISGYPAFAASLDALEAHDAEQVAEKKLTDEAAEIEALFIENFHTESSRDSLWRRFLKACPDLMDRLRELKVVT